MNNDTHIFALYCPLFHEYQKGSLVLDDADLVHRITRILRLGIGDTFILFDRSMHGQLTIANITRQSVTSTLHTKHTNKPWQCSITFFLPVLKKEALAAAVYSLVEAGVQDIQLLSTQKIQRKFGGDKERQRLERIILAAAEQSKNFIFPTIKDPMPLPEALALLANTTAYVGNPSGKPVVNIFKDTHQIPERAALFVGPEGGFTATEWALFEKANIISLQLTPTILRAEMAAFCLAAFFRSIKNHKE
jgi:16S rRNA (uracil1498-N3)-methyltransferase